MCVRTHAYAEGSRTQVLIKTFLLTSYECKDIQSVSYSSYKHLKYFLMLNVSHILKKVFHVFII